MLGYLPLASEAAASLFQVVTQRSLKGSIVLTTNRGIGPAWAEIFQDPMVAAAMLDRLLHRAAVLQIEGESYRMRAHRARVDAMRRTLTTPVPDVLRNDEHGPALNRNGVAGSRKEHHGQRR